MIPDCVSISQYHSLGLCERTLRHASPDRISSPRAIMLSSDAEIFTLPGVMSRCDTYSCDCSACRPRCRRVQTTSFGTHHFRYVLVRLVRLLAETKITESMSYMSVSKYTLKTTLPSMAEDLSVNTSNTPYKPQFSVQYVSVQDPISNFSIQ